MFCFDPCIGFVTVPIIQKMPFFAISLDFQTLKSEPPPVPFLPSKTQSKTQHLWTSIHLRIIVLFFDSVSQCSETSKKKLFNFKFSRTSNSFSTRTPGFISSIRVGIEKNRDVEKFPVRELPNCVLCMNVLTVRSFQEVLLFFYFALFSDFFSSATTSSNSSSMKSV